MSATLTTETTTEVQPTATLVIRVPRGSDGGLGEGAKRKLASLSHISAVQITHLRNISPRGGATYVTVDVTLTMAFESLPENLSTTVRDILTDSVAVDSIESLSAPQPSPAPMD